MNPEKQSTLALRLTIPLRQLFLFIVVTLSLHANDLRIEDFSVVTKLDGTEVTNTKLGYLKDSQIVSFDILLLMTWEAIDNPKTREYDPTKPYQSTDKGGDISFYVDVSATSGGSIKSIVENMKIYQHELSYRDSNSSLIENLYKTYTVSLSTSSDFHAWAAQHYENGDDFSFKVKIDVDPNLLPNKDGLVEEEDETNNDATIQAVEFVPLSGDMNYGSAVVSVQDVQTIKEDDVGCGTSGIRLYSNEIDWTPSSSGTWSTVSFSPDPYACVEYIYNSSTGGLDLIGLDPIVLNSTTTGTLGGIEVTVEATTLSSSGAVPSGAVTATLPEDHTTHAIDLDDNPIPRGSRNVNMNASSAVGDYNDLVLSKALPVFLHADALPFMLRTVSLSLDNSGFFGDYDKINYVYDVTFNVNDIRSKEAYRIRTNDAYLSSPSSDINTFTITNLGLQTSVNFNSGSGRSHFPQTKLAWQDFTLPVVNSQIGTAFIPQATIDLTAFSISEECGTCRSPSFQVNVYHIETQPDIGMGIAADGALAARVNNPLNPSWGPYDFSALKHIFSRGESDQGIESILYFPGFKATYSGGTDNVSVAEYLMGMRSMTDNGKTIFPQYIHHLSSAMAQRGNYFMAGLTVGPEIYSDASAQPVEGYGSSLEGKKTSIGFGGPDQGNYTDITDGAGSKYVVRRGGVTGVFNGAVESMNINVYGYDHTLTKFAFRQVNNTMDDYNWIEGGLTVPGKANFDLKFNRLELECNGHFGDIHIVREACDGSDPNGNGIPDENCNMYLEAWKTPIELLSVRYASTTENEAVCSRAERQLQIGHTFDVAALDKQLVMRANWSPDGNPNDVQISGESDVVFDRPNVAVGSPEDRGFAMVIDRGVALKTPGGVNNDGWVEMNGQIGLPFWETLDVTTRFANQSETEPAQTIVHEKGGSLSGSVTSDSLMSNTALADMLDDRRSGDPFKSRYQWGNTSIGFGMPIFYESGRYGLNEPPRFLGHMYNRDFVVMNANAGVDYIDSERTKLSFGASADFEKLRALEMDLHVDVGDPESLMSIDKYFCKLKSFDSCDLNETVKGPVSKIVGSVTEKLNILNDAASSGIDKLIREGVEEGIDGSIDLLGGTDPFETAANVMAEVQTLPQQAAAKTAESLKEITENMIAPLTDDLDSLAYEIYIDLPEKLADGYTPGTGELEALEEKLQDLQAVLGEVEPVFDDVSNGIQNARTELTNLVTDVTGLTAEVSNSINSIKTDILGTLSMTDDFADDTPTNKVLHQIRELQNYSLTSVKLLGVMDLETFAYLLVAFTGVDLTGVAAAEREIKQMVAELKETITEADEQMKALLKNKDYATMLTDSIAFLDDINARIAEVNTKIIDVNNRLQIHSDGAAAADGGYFGLLETKVEDARDYLKSTIDKVNQFELAVSGAINNMDHIYVGMTADEIRSAMNNQVLDLSSYRYGWFDEVKKETFVKKVALDLRDPIDGGIAQVSVAIADALGPIASQSFNMSAEEFKSVIISKIMNSDIIEEVHRIAHINTTAIVERINDVSGIGFDQVNHIVQNAIVAMNEKANELLQSATGDITASIPLKAAKVDGYGLMTGNELERLHIGASWTMVGDEEDSSSTYGAALDILNNSSNGEGSGCSGDADSSFFASISASGLPLSIGTSSASISLLKLTFLINGMTPEGIFGEIGVDGTIDFEAFKLYGLHFGAGLGLYEVYMGASASAAFDDLQLDMSFLVGKTCSLDLLEALDPQVADFITVPNGVFNGVYARGGASVPIYDYGCALEVGVSADIGTWFLIGPPITIGGLVGGGAYGEALCIASLRGEVTAYGQKSGDKYTFGGEGFGVAGAGWDCDKHTWTSVSRSRNDGGCGTGDASFKVIYDSGWNVVDLDSSKIY